MNFRIWDKIRERYVSGGELVFALYGDVNISVIPNAEEYIGVETRDSDFIIEHSSGKFDINGKEVFNGDIIKATHYNFSHPDTIKIQEVYYENACFCVRSFGDEVINPLQEDRNNVPLFWLDAPSTFEIIGNIHTYEKTNN